MKPSISNERYCYACHKILDLSKFTKPSINFRTAKKCISCENNLRRIVKLPPGYIKVYATYTPPPVYRYKIVK